MVRNSWLYGGIYALLAFGVSPSPGFTLSTKEARTFPANEIRTVIVRKLQFTDFVYRGSPTEKRYTVKFEKRSENGSDRDMRDVLSEIELETRVSGSTLEITLRSPRHSGRGIFDRWFNRKTWRVALEITGPSAVDADIQAGFSDLRISSTSGRLTVSPEFSTVEVTDHEGTLTSRQSFTSFTGEGIGGRFDINSEFGRVNLRMSHLTGDSRASVSFGNCDIYLPKDTGAVFRANSEFGGVKFMMTGRISTDDDRGNRRVLNDGGPDVRLDAEFGEINVRDNNRVFTSPARPVFRPDLIMPLLDGAFWKYAKDDETSTLRVEKTRIEDGRIVTTLTFDNGANTPFGSIDVYETSRGLFLYGINRSFFGKDISGVLMNPPVLMLPYSQDDSPVSGGDILGTIRIDSSGETAETPTGSVDNVISYSLDNSSRTSHTIRLVPGVGILSFDDFQLVSYSLTKETSPSESDTMEVAEKPYRFEKGVISSIEIAGNRMRSDQKIRRLLNLNENQTYTDADISEAIKRVEEDSYVDYASYVVDPEGRLRVRVYEIRPYDTDFGADASFSRVAGLGLGPTLDITSHIGPISHVHGKALYNWGIKDWTWEAGADREFFQTNIFRFGGGYRYGFGSNMDWTIPEEDAGANAFIFGEETMNYFHAEGGYGFISQKIGDFADARLEYFENTYSSAGKETDWSLFNRGRTKKENPPLSPGSAARITGTRLELNGRYDETVTNVRTSIEVERTFRKKTSDYPAYTRVLAQGSWNVQYWYDNLMKVRVAGGWSNTTLPDQRAFQLGGLNTLRGFNVLTIPAKPSGVTPFTSFDGGDRMFLANIDYFWGNDLSIIFFGDVGGVWGKGETIRLSSLKRDVGVGIAFGSDFFDPLEHGEKNSGFRVNWAVPVGNERHVSRWTVNFVRAY